MYLPYVYRQTIQIRQPRLSVELRHVKGTSNVIGKTLVRRCPILTEWTRVRVGVVLSPAPRRDEYG